MSQLQQRPDPRKMPVLIERGPMLRAMLVTEANRHLFPDIPVGNYATWDPRYGLRFLPNEAEPVDRRYVRIDRTGTLPPEFKQRYIERTIIVDARYYPDGRDDGQQPKVPAGSYLVYLSSGPGSPEKAIVMSAAEFEARYEPVLFDESAVKG